VSSPMLAAAVAPDSRRAARRRRPRRRPHARRRLPHHGARSRRGRDGQRLAQPVRGQRHQALRRPRTQAPGRRERAAIERVLAALAATPTTSARGRARTTGRTVRRYAHATVTTSATCSRWPPTSTACASASTSRTAPRSRSRRASSSRSAPGSTSINAAPDGQQHQRRLRQHAPSRRSPSACCARPRHRGHLRRRRRSRADGRRPRPLVTGDHMLAICAVVRRERAVVATSMTNLGVERWLERRASKLERVQVGDRYVFERLRQTTCGSAASSRGTCCSSTRRPPVTGSSRRCRCWRPAGPRACRSMRGSTRSRPIPSARERPGRQRRPATRSPRRAGGAGDWPRRPRRWATTVASTSAPSGTEHVVRAMVEAADAGTVERVSTTISSPPSARPPRGVAPSLAPSTRRHADTVVGVSESSAPHRTRRRCRAWIDVTRELSRATRTGPATPRSRSRRPRASPTAPASTSWRCTPARTPARTSTPRTTTTTTAAAWRACRSPT
jgi:hypothetical protein